MRQCGKGNRRTSNLDVHVTVQQQVLCLEVPVHHPVVVAVLYSTQDLPELAACFTLCHTSVLGDVVCGDIQEVYVVIGGKEEEMEEEVTEEVTGDEEKNI